MITRTGIKNVTIEAVVTRKDGTVEDLGVVSKKSLIDKILRKVKGNG